MEHLKDKTIYVCDKTSLEKALGVLECIDGDIYVDLEGINLSKTGSVTLIQVYIPKSDVILIYDLLQIDDLFVACPKLKAVFESTVIKKIFFDFRNDINALYFIYKIDVHFVDCVQVKYMAELFEKNIPSATLHGLVQVFANKLPDFPELVEAKRNGRQFTDDQVVERPLQPEVLLYAAIDVYYLHQVDLMIKTTLSAQVKTYIQRRLDASKTAGFVFSDMLNTNFPFLRETSNMMNAEQMQGFEHAIDFSKQLVFITGPGGTGKSFLINKITDHCLENSVNIALTAPTGIAAININGQTLTSFFGIPVGLVEKEQIYDCEYNRFLTDNKVYQIKKRLIETLKKLQILIIDEISMVNAKLLEIVDIILREVLDKSRCFGGMKICFFGDFYQLPPTPISYIKPSGVADKEATPKYCFESTLWRDINTVELIVSYRQKDTTLFSMLSNIRIGNIEQRALTFFQANCVRISRLSTDPEYDDFTVLFASNKEKDDYNKTKYDQSSSDGETTFTAVVKIKAAVDASTVRAYFKLIPQQITLKPGIKVLNIKNNRNLNIANGDKGVITEVSNDGVRLVIERTNMSVYLKRQTWNIVSYSGEEIISITQIPLIYSWANTVHKSQGLSLNKLVVDFSRFHLEGQAYVALSRATNIENLKVVNFSASRILTNRRVHKYYKTAVRVVEPKLVKVRAIRTKHVPKSPSVATKMLSGLQQELVTSNQRFLETPKSKMGFLRNSSCNQKESKIPAQPLLRATVPTPLGTRCGVVSEIKFVREIRTTRVDNEEQEFF